MTSVQLSLSARQASLLAALLADAVDQCPTETRELELAAILGLVQDAQDEAASRPHTVGV